MFRQRQVIQNKVIASEMRRFCRRVDKLGLGQSPSEVAKLYGRELWDRRTEKLVLMDKKRFRRSRFYIGLCVERVGLAELTRRAVLVSDTLLISHGTQGKFHELGVSDDGIYGPPATHFTRYGGGGSSALLRSSEGQDFVKTVLDWRADAMKRDRTVTNFGMYCPDIDVLGRWILEAGPLLKAGLAWYLPSYATTRQTMFSGRPWPESMPEQVKAIDYLIRDGRAVDASGAEPIKGKLVRPILHIDLPFVDGVNLRDFSKIITHEFNSYSGFRTFLQLTFLEMDDALNATQSDQELTRLGLQIAEGVRMIASRIRAARRRRAVAVTGATVGLVGATLAAVYGPALEEALKVLGTGSGMWGIIDAVSANSPHHLREDKWYFVWALSKKTTE